MKITFDWNCLIEVQDQRPQARDVLQLVEMHRKGEVEVAMLAASASENNASRQLPGSSAVFEKRRQELGWEDLPLVPMVKVWGLSYWGFSSYPADSEAFKRDFDAIWHAIAPNCERNWKSYLTDKQAAIDNAIQSKPLAKWRNTWCDVMSAYSHINAKRDVFVTLNTRDFQRNSERLAELGMGKIRDPRTLVNELTSSLKF